MDSTKTATLSVRLKPSVKKKASNVLTKLGISHSDAINLYYTQIALKNRIPFDLTIEENDTPQNYTKVKNKKHLKELLGL
jgi:addiction module RelB/DinJ family antitoxin